MANESLLELFAVCDDVFSEDDRFASPETMRMSLGRIYRSYKQARAALLREAETFGRGQ